MVREVLMRHGLYVLTDVPAGTRQVRARFVGYASVTQSVAVDAASGTTLDFRLVAAPIQLEGLVVVGYGTQERRDLTGSIGSVTLQQIAEVPTSNPMQAIQARVAGVDVVAGGSYRPGIPMNVTVRGIRSIAAGNGPLYVVDGVPLAGGIEDFNPATIQSIEVLKDASATAVYGSRGSNGVILITTRRGAAGVPDNTIRVSYDAQYGAQSALHLVDMMNGPETIAERRAARRTTRACSHPTSCPRCSAPRMRRIRPRMRDARPARIGSAACCGPALSSAISSASRPSRGPPGSPSPAATSIRTASRSARGIGSTPAR